MTKPKMPAKDPNVVGLDGAPVARTVIYDQGVADILERALAAVKSGRCTGVAVVMLGPHESGYEVNCFYQGPRLTLISGATRLVHQLNRDLDQ
jgi:hypothetical protein